MNPSDPLTPEQKAAQEALENHAGEWGSLARAMGTPREEMTPPLSNEAIARLEAVRLRALATAQKRVVRPSRSLWSSPVLRLAAALVVLGAAAWLLIPHSASDSNAEIAITSPRGDTATTRPVIDWQAKPGKSYDVWILPAKGDVLTVPAVFKAEKVRPPVDFAVLKAAEGTPVADLKPDADYRVLVCYADTHRVGGIAIPFHVKPSPPKP